MYAHALSEHREMSIREDQSGRTGTSNSKRGHTRPSTEGLDHAVLEGISSSSLSTLGKTAWESTWIWMKRFQADTSVSSNDGLQQNSGALKLASSQGTCKRPVREEVMTSLC